MASSGLTGRQRDALVRLDPRRFTAGHLFSTPLETTPQGAHQTLASLVRLGLAERRKIRFQGRFVAGYRATGRGTREVSGLVRPWNRPLPQTEATSGLAPATIAPAPGADTDDGQARMMRGPAA